jgi:hypothetical protein
VKCSDEWLGEEEAAEWLGVPMAAVRSGVDSGDIPVLYVGGYRRISRTALIGLASRPAGNGSRPSAATPSEAESEGVLESLPPPEGFEWINELRQAEGFIHGWPQHGGGYSKESYPEAWEAEIKLKGEKGNEQLVRVGRSSGAERKDKRPRLTVFLRDFPVAEFIGTADGTKLASVIKPNGKKTISDRSQLPPLYRRVRTASYSEVTGLAGMGRPKGLAVLINPEDLRSAVHHAAARRLGRLGEALRPSSW